MKLPRIWHLEWSENLQNDDRRLPDQSCFDGKENVYTEKLDGEGTGCSKDFIHARSEDGYGKPWQHYMKKLYSCFAPNIPEGMIVYGENVYAIHSIGYDSLPTCFFVFAILYKEEWLSWEETVFTSELLGLDTVPEITRGPLFKLPCPKKSFFGTTCEGYVIRNVLSYKKDDFQTNIAKMVRKNHVQTDSVHWTQNWKPAKFIEDPIERLYRKMAGH